jgi:hypothetical protein
MLAYALARAGDTGAAVAALQRGAAVDYPPERFPGVTTLLRDDALFLRSTERVEAVRLCLYWETDATDVDLHVYDRLHRHFRPGPRRAVGGLDLSARDGYGPECFTAQGNALAYPYHAHAHQLSRGPMGHTLASLHVVRRSRDGELHTELRPIIFMRPDAYAPLGTIARPAPVLASAVR